MKHAICCYGCGRVAMGVVQLLWVWSFSFLGAVCVSVANVCWHDGLLFTEALNHTSSGHHL